MSRSEIRPSRPIGSGGPLRRAATPHALRALWITPLILVAGAVTAPRSAMAQATGQILGRVTDASTGELIQSAKVSVEGLELGVLTSERGDFILPAVAVGEYELVVELLGYRTTRASVLVRAGRTLSVQIELTPAPIEVEGVAAEVERSRLIEPDVTETHQVVLGRELRELPVDNVDEVIELTPGVAEGHFRGGRAGQETYRIDGLDIKNQFEASNQGPALEVSPYALEEVDVVTGGFGSDNGSALSGLVSYVTRRGDPSRWTGRASLSSDEWAPDAALRGFTGVATSIGGPLRFLGAGSTIFVDLLAQGMVDFDPRGRGLTCLRPKDGGEDLARAIAGLTEDPATAPLYCPYTSARIPYQRGDKLIGFLRLDRPLGESTNLTVTLLHNRRQTELYTPEFKYNSEYQLGQRTKGLLGTLNLDWARHHEGRAYHLTARAAGMRLDRYLGVIDPWTFDGRTRIAGFGLGDFRFLGEDFVRKPIEEQIESGLPVPGYSAPSGRRGSPFGPAAEGIFVTEGTSGIANWNRTEFLAFDLDGEMISARGTTLRAGASARLYRVENYERVLSFLPGSSPSFARFYPTTVNAYAEVSLLTIGDITTRLGVRLEAFRSDLKFQSDRGDISSPLIEPSWNALVMPRFGVAIPIPHTQRRTVTWFNFSQVAQPPDFRFFLDSTIGDSLRVDIRRQGNPNLAFERGNSFEVGLSHLLSEGVAFNVVGFLKELTSLVTSSLSFTNTVPNQFTTGDFGSVVGFEVGLRGRWPIFEMRLGYALQEAKGVTSSAFEDVDSTVAEGRLEFPLAFDRRHTIDAVFLFGQAAGSATMPVGASLTAAIRSGYPLNRLAAAGDPTLELGSVTASRLPWTAALNLRISYDLGSLGTCSNCRWRVLLDGRNITNRDNVIALRRDTGELAPSVADLESVATNMSSGFEPIPFESPGYSQLVDLDGDGIIELGEFETARFAAALDASDPSLFFGEDLQLRIGMEFTF